jgi:cobalt-zinc-cadmium efflux system protein
MTYNNVARDAEWRLRRAAVLTGAFLVLEFVAGLAANSLALISDAGHMFMDAAALLLALIALGQGRRPPDRKRTFGYRRFEILAALANGGLLLVVALTVLREAWIRMSNPPQVGSGLMFWVALVGLVINGVVLLLLRRGRRDDLNLRGVLLHVAGDTIGSIGVISAAVIVRFTGWNRADPLASILISLLIVAGAGRLIKESLHYLLEGTPREIDLPDVSACLCEVPGVVGVHDLHLWRISSGMDILTAHVVLQDPGASRETRSRLRERLRERFGVAHATLEIEGSEEGLDPEHVRGICDG